LEFVIVSTDAMTGIEIPLQNDTDALSTKMDITPSPVVEKEKNAVGHLLHASPSMHATVSPEYLSATHKYAYPSGSSYTKDSGYLHNLSPDEEGSLAILKRLISKANVCVEVTSLLACF
jgi:hypothetical protein